MSVQEEAVAFVNAARKSWDELVAAFLEGRNGTLGAHGCAVHYIQTAPGVISEQWLVEESTGDVLLKLKIEFGQEGETIAIKTKGGHDAGNGTH